MGEEIFLSLRQIGIIYNEISQTSNAYKVKVSDKYETKYLEIFDPEMQLIKEIEL